jgi:hypothetical protein
VEADCWKKRKALANNNSIAALPQLESQSRNTYVTYVSTQQEHAENSALIDSGAVFTVVGLATLDRIMRAHSIGKIEKCQPLSLVHRFGTNGTPLEPEFGVIIPWVVRDVKGTEHSFNLRADVLEGDFPLLIGFPTLIAMRATIYFGDLKLSAVINDTPCDLPIRQDRNRLFMDHAPRAVVQTTNNTVYQNPFSLGHDTAHYELPAEGTVQLFRRPDHC